MTEKRLLALVALLIGLVAGLLILVDAVNAIQLSSLGSMLGQLVGVVLGVVPNKGITLPLVSYGGTAMISLFIGLGVLMSVQAHRKLVAT